MGFKKFLSKVRPGNYLRELSVVILGIFITLTATNYFAGRSKKAEYRQIMEMVHAELVDNKRVIDETIEGIVHQQKIMEYLFGNRQHLDTIPYDTLHKYRFVQWTMEFLRPAAHALEVLKYSSSIHFNNDITVLRDIMQAYDNVQLCFTYIDTYYDDKTVQMEMLSEEVDWRGYTMTDLLKMQYNSQAMRDYLSSSLRKEVVAESKKQSNEIGLVIRALENKYRIKNVFRFEFYPVDDE